MVDENNGKRSPAPAPGNSNGPAAIGPAAAPIDTADGPDATEPSPAGFFDPAAAAGAIGSSSPGSSSPGSTERKGPGGWNKGKRRVNGKWISDPGPTPGSSSPGSSSPGSSSPGSSSPKPKTKNPASLESIEGILLSVHMMLASFTQIKELELAPEEAARLSQAIARVAALYDIEATEKTMALANLMACAGNIYGTRLFAYKLRREAEEDSKKAPKLVTSFPGQSYTQQAQAQAPGM